MTSNYLLNYNFHFGIFVMTLTFFSLSPLDNDNKNIVIFCVSAFKKDKGIFDEVIYNRAVLKKGFILLNRFPIIIELEQYL